MITIDKNSEDGIFHLSGVIDENFPTSEVLAYNELKLDFRKIIVVTSVGVREFAKFLQLWGRRSIEFHQASPAMVDAFNTFSVMLGQPAQPERIKSIITDAWCKTCKQDFLIRIRTVNVTYAKLLYFSPGTDCKTCGLALSLREDPKDLFCFLIGGTP